MRHSVVEPEPKLFTKVEPEPKINDFGSATLLLFIKNIGSVAESEPVGAGVKM